MRTIVNVQTGEITQVPDDTIYTDPILPTKEQQEAARKAAYISEADPLYFKWQAGESSQEEWIAKRAEIKLRYPYPELE